MNRLSDNPQIDKILQNHFHSGKTISVNGVQTFYLDQGNGDAVILVHGVPSSSYLYRKIVPRLAQNGYRAISMDFPGMGLSDKPTEFDYSWTGLKNHLRDFLKKIGITEFHLVVHDIGGPVGFLLLEEMINNDHTSNILSLSILNTLSDAKTFERPFPMNFFAIPVIGEVWASMMNHFTTTVLFQMKGVQDISKSSQDEIAAYADLLYIKNGHDSFLKIMRSFELNRDIENKIHRVLQNPGFPKSVIWGMDDPTLTFEKFGQRIIELASPKRITKLPGKHFFQEESYEEISKELTEFLNTIH